MTTPVLVVSASPHLGAKDSTPRIMWTVAASLAPIVAAGAWFFGISALLVIAAATAGALVTERFFGKSGSLWDGSAAITGVILGLTLPAGLPLWMAVLGGAFGIGFGKILFGGLGQNVFNPALIGRAFLQASFPVPMTTWPGMGGAWWTLRGDNLALPPDQELLADLCAATWEPSGANIAVESKDAIKERIGRSPDRGDAILLAHGATPHVPLFGFF